MPRKNQAYKFRRRALVYVSAAAAILLTVLLVYSCTVPPDTDTDGGYDSQTSGSSAATAVSESAVSAASSDSAASSAASSASKSAAATTVSVKTAAPVSTTVSTTASTVVSTSVQTTAKGSAGVIGYVQTGTPAWNLKLVNRWNPVSESYAVSLTSYEGKGQFDSRAVDSLRALIKAGKAHNIRVVANMFRSYSYQSSLFEKQVNRELAANPSLSRAQAEELASTDTARPGTSEHHLGLAADFLFENHTQLLEGYEHTEAYKWMKAHCAEYGFILRYPKDKQAITGVIFEPWHYRYVGTEAAGEIMSRGITLEEYLYERNG